MKKIILLPLCFLFLFFSSYGCQSQVLYKDKRLMMGTFVEVTSPYKEAAQIVFDEIARIENLLSGHKKNSEVSRLNKSGELEASPETFYIIKKSKEFCRLSGGAFDITVAVLAELWGFKDKQYDVPGEDRIKNALKLIGCDKIILNESNNVVKFMLPGMKIDLGAVAKGYAVDCAVKRLKQKGLNSCLINAGGDIYCLGGRFESPWRVAVQNPRSANFSDSLHLKDRAVATSGDYEQYFMKGPKRYSHIFNPKTGFPENSGVLSATVVSSDCATADFLATAIMVLGKEQGERLAKKFPFTEVIIITGPA